VIDRHNNIVAVDTLPQQKPFLTTYIIIDKRVAIVDCGPKKSIPLLLRALEELEIEPDDVAYILLSHIHIDHAGGAGELIKYLPNARVVMHPRGVPHMVDPKVLWRKTKEVLGKLADFYGEILPVPEERIIIAEEGSIIDLGNDKIVIWETPGHASHSVTYELRGKKVIFPGDTAGVYIVPWDTYFPTTPTPFNVEKALLSLDKLIGINPQTICFPHYGVTKDGVDYLRGYREKLRLWVEIISSNATRRTDDILDALLEKDKELSSSWQLIANHDIWRGSILRSIEGIKAYLKWKEKTART